MNHRHTYSILQTVRTGIAATGLFCAILAPSAQAATSQSITFNAPASITFGATPFIAQATSSSGLAVSFSSGTPTVCTVSGNLITLAGEGTCTIAANQAGNSTYAPAAQVTQSFAVSIESQTITFAAPSNQGFGTSPILSATASSGLPVSYTSTTSSVCTVSGATLTPVSLGTCTINANQAGNASVHAAPQVTQSFAVVKGNQAITFNAPAADTFGGAPFIVQATSSAGLTVSFTTSTPTVCTVASNVITLTGAGTCTIAANQAGNANYNAATQVTQSFADSMENQTITFATPSSQGFGTSPVLTATASSGLPISYASSTPAVCTVSGATLTPVSAGTCTITANQAGNASVHAAAQVTQSFAIVKGNQTITFNAPATDTYGGAPFIVQAISSSGLTVSFTASTPAVCTASGNLITLTGAGTCTIAANQAGNANYNAATQVTQSFTDNMESQTITFAAPSSPGFGVALVLTATASSGLPVSYTSTTPAICTVSGATLTPVSLGTCTINAHQAGNASVHAALQVTQSFSIVKGNQTITYYSPAPITFGAAPFIVQATSSSGLTVGFTSSTPTVCTVSSNLITLTGAGTCTIASNQTGNANYNAAVQVSESFVVAAENQTISFAALLAKSYGTAPFTVAATSSASLPLTFTSLTASVCTVSGTTVTLVGAGNCTIAANQAGNNAYAAAAQVVQSFVVAAQSQSINFTAPANISYGSAPISLTATATSGLPISFSSTTTAICTVSGATVTFAGAGMCTIAANQAGNTNVSAAPQIVQSFAIAVASQTISFAGPANTVYGATPVTLAATATSGLPVSFASNTTTVCTVTGSAVTLLGAGTCTLFANQPGNTNFAAAPQATQSFTVAAALPPAIALTSPISGQSLTAPATLNLAATASDANGTITQVAFYNGSALLGTVTQAPYNITLPNLPPGTYSMTAQATDSLGLTATSNAVAVTVTPSAAVAVSLINVNFNANPSSTTYQTQPYFPVSTDISNGALIADQMGNLYFTSFGKNYVQQIKPDGTAGMQWTGLNAPGSLVAAKDGSGILTSTSSGLVHLGFDGSQTQLNTYADLGSLNYSPSGVLYSTSYPSDTIYQISDAGQVTTFIASGIVTGPTGFVFNDTGSMIVAAQKSGQILQINPDKSIQTLMSLNGATSVARYGQGWLVSSTTGIFLVNAQWQTQAKLFANRGDEIAVLPNGNVIFAQAGVANYNQIVSVPAVGSQTSYNNISLTTPANLMLASSIIDSAGIVSQVSFFSGTNLLGVTTQAPYTFNWNNIAPGSYTITAQTTDSLGQVGISVPINLTVVASTTGALQTAQTITFGSLANAIYGSAPITLSATASSGLPLTFTSGTNAVCTVAGSTVTLVNAGTCTILANQVGSSNYYSAPTVTQSFTVAPSPIAITLTSPAIGQAVFAPATMILAATATDSTATITQVAFYNGTLLLGTVTQAPYTLTLPNMAAGTYNLTAQATDSAGLTVSSSVMTLVVESVLGTWTAQVLPSPQSWRGIGYGAGKFVTLGWATTTAAYSTDNGATWAISTLPTYAQWLPIIYGNGTYVALAYGSTVAATSPDAIHWTQHTLPTSANWDAIAYGNGLFVALGKAGVAATSPDGATWTALTLPINADSITFGNGQFVALSSGSNIAVTSPDGLNWTQRTLPSAAPWVGITYGNGLYVAITYGSAVTASSPDGINWSQSAMPESGQWVTIAFGDGAFVAVGGDNLVGTLAATSTDGITWTNNNLPVASNWTGLAYGNNTFVATAGGNFTINAAALPVIKAPPAVTLTAPVANQSAIAPATITLSATAASTDTTVAQVQFFNGTTLIGTVRQAPYTLSWANVQPGTYSLSATATDNVGMSASTAPSTITVNNPLAINVTTSAAASGNGQPLISPANLTLTANATDATGTITQVQFFNGATLLGTVTQSPFTFAMSNLAAATYSINAVVTDSNGYTASSAPVNVTVIAPIVLNWTGPLNNAQIAGKNLTLSATATVSNSTITQVAFFNGISLMATVTKAPYSVTFPDVEPGTYTFTAQAIDSVGLTVVTSPVTVTVVAAGSGAGTGTGGAEQVYDVHTDQLNTPRLITDSNGNAVWQWDSTDPFGDNLPNQDPNGTGNQFVFNLRFLGQYFDQETSLHHNRRRDYDPATGREIQSDPMGLAGGSASTYSYVGGNPLSEVDPFGYMSKGECKALRDRIYRKNGLLQNELAKYDPFLDGQGGFSMKYGSGFTKPGGHFKEITDLQRGIKSDLANYNQGCKCDENDDDDHSGPPKVAITRNVDALANSPVEAPPNLPFSGVYSEPSPGTSTSSPPWWILLLPIPGNPIYGGL